MRRSALTVRGVAVGAQRGEEGPGMEKHEMADGSPSQEETEAIFDRFLAIMKVGSTDAVAGHGLSLAHSITHVHITDADDLTVSLLLDRQPVEAVEGAVGDAEIEIFISS